VKVLVTGSNGFIGRNLGVALKRRGTLGVFEADVGTTDEELGRMAEKADAVFHLAGVNRPENDEEFHEGNAGSAERLCRILEHHNRTPLVVLSSSSQAVKANAYGRSKKAAEEIVSDFGRRTGAEVRIFRLPGVFGKWCRPNYNSVVATFCHNIARGKPVEVSDPGNRVALVHVDEVVRVFLGLLDGVEPDRENDICTVAPVSEITLGALADLIRSFRESRLTNAVPPVSEYFSNKLYSTYLSYLPEEEFGYALRQHADPRGELAEVLRSPGMGQVFVSRTRPGITRGNHFHDSKTEKFVIVDGEAVVRFRHILGGDVIKYKVIGREFRVVDIPPGYTHNITNVGNEDLIVLFWASEPFDPENPDTWACEV